MQIHSNLHSVCVNHSFNTQTTTTGQFKQVIKLVIGMLNEIKTLKSLFEFGSM